MVNYLTPNYPIYQAQASYQKPAVKPEQKPVSKPQNSMVNKFLAGHGVKGFYMPIQKTSKVQEAQTQPSNYKNNLRSMFKNNQVVMDAIIVRTFNAKDTNGNGLVQGGEQKGTFINAIERLDELKAHGVNTFHLIPIHPPGDEEAMGNAGSAYAPLDLLKIDPALDDPNDPRGVKEEMKAFVDECHKRDMKVMIDLPSCVSLDFYNKPENKKYMAVARTGAAQVPQGWNDIRMFNPFGNHDTRELNKELVELHKDYVDMCVDLGLDGIRADVGRAKPPEFWDEIIPYSRAKDPEFAWLAETYTYEDASPMLNMPKDRPEDLLNAGFDSYYGQYHIYDQWDTGEKLHDYIRENIEMSQRLEPGKSLIGSFATHDDISPMYHGKTRYCNLTSGLMATLPMTNPYFVDGYLTGDFYKYKYGNKLIDRPEVAEQKLDNNEHLRTYEVHPGRIDIFNTSRRPDGNNPEIGEFFKSAMEMRKDHEDIITKGSYIPLKVEGPKSSEGIVAYARHKDGKTLLVVANRNVNHRLSGSIEIPGLTPNQDMKNLVDSYGEKSQFQPHKNVLSADLGAGRFHVFEINTPNIESQSDEVLKQKLY